MAKNDKQKLLNKILRCAELYETNLNKKNFIYIIRGRDNKPFHIEVAYYDTNFCHLMGVETQLEAYQFYMACLSGKLSERDFILRRDGASIQKSVVSMELMSIHKRAKMYGESGLLFTDKLLGNHRGCIGYVKDEEAGFFFPNTLLETDIKISANDWFPVLAVYQKYLDEPLYSIICYKSNIHKDIDYDKLSWPEEIHSKIDIKKLVSDI